MSLSVSNWLAMIGLALDIFGALFLAKGFMAKRIREIVRESGTYIGRNVPLRNSLIQQKVEARIGGIFLTCGFGLQLLSYMFQKEIINVCSIILILFAFGLVILSLWWIASRISWRIANSTIGKLDRTQLAEEIENIEKNHSVQLSKNLPAWGRRLGLMRLDGESDTEYFNRIKQHLSNSTKYPSDSIK